MGGSGAITTGTTILQGMKNAAPGAQIDYSSTGVFTNTSAQYSVVIIGETPYAEYGGDRTDLTISKTDIDLVKKMKSYGAPVVVILVSGRPLIIEKLLHFSDVIVAAWLPGTEGDGIADVLFGDYQPVGRLSHTWPKTMAQIPINVGDSNYFPLYEYGFGITSLSDSPAGSAPVCLSAIIANDGKHYELTFNKRMKDPSSVQASFVFAKNKALIVPAVTLSLKQNDSTIIIVELDAAYYSINDVGAISYRSGNIQSFDDASLQAFAFMDAVNWTGSATVINENKNLIPLVNKLNQNYPNPFNPTTTISYQLALQGHVSLKVYDVLGRQIVTLVDEVKSAGTYTVSWDAAKLSSGVYFYRLQVGDFNDLKRLILVK
jgi:hypothetical protein